MAKRIYSETVKKWAIGAGVSASTFAALLIIYLQFLGAIQVNGYSGDSICSGTELDPCYAYVNITAKEDIFVYPMGLNDTLFSFNPGVKSWRFEEYINGTWKTIDLNQTLTNKVAYAYVFREGKDYNLRVIGYKYNISDSVKWSFVYDEKELVDPEWYSPLDEDINLESDLNKTKTFIDDGGKGRIVISENAKEVASYKLEENTNYCADVCSLILNSSITESDYLIRNIVAYKKGTKIVDESVKFEYYLLKNVNRTFEEKSNIKTTCKDVEYKNKSIGSDCVTTYDSKNVTKEVLDWEYFDIYSEKLTGNYTLKVIGTKPVLANVEWVVEAYGKEFTEWDVWNSVFTQNLRFWWEFNETGEVSTADEFISNNDASGTSIDNTNWGAGKLGGAVTLDGANEWFNMTDDAGFDNLTAQFTIMAWVYPNNLEGDDGVIINQYLNGNEKFLFWIENDNPNIYYNSGGSMWGAGTNQKVTDARWSLVGFTYDSTGDQTNGYINGTLAYQVNFTFVPLQASTAGPMIGKTARYTTQAGYAWKGSIDQIMIWDRVLNQTEVTALWNSGGGLLPADIIDATPPVPTEKPTVTLNKPIANDKFISTSILFNATIDVTISQINNYTLFIWNSTDSVFHTNHTNINSTTDITNTWTVPNFLTDTYKWNVYACANTTAINCSWSTNVTFNKICYFYGTVKDGENNAISGARVVIMRDNLDTFYLNTTTNTTGYWFANHTVTGFYNIYAYEQSNASRPADIKSKVQCT